MPRLGDVGAAARRVIHRAAVGAGSVSRVTIWIDPPAWPAHGRLWSHLVSDTSYDELHDFAAAQGIPRRGFEGDHYDVPEESYAALVAAGAAPVDGREVVRILQRSGLRIQKRKHERVVQAVPGAPWLPPGSRADVIASRQDEPPANTVLVRLALLRGPRPAGGRTPGRRLGPARPGGGRHGRARRWRRWCDDLMGAPTPCRRRLLGYVRNTVPTPDADYPWPVPKACFAVYTTASLRRTRPATAPGWRPIRRRSRTVERHWWPLIGTWARTSR